MASVKQIVTLLKLDTSRGLSHALANELGISRQAVDQWIHNGIPDKSLCKIIRKYNLPTDLILGNRKSNG